MLKNRTGSAQYFSVAIRRLARIAKVIIRYSADSNKKTAVTGDPRAAFRTPGNQGRATAVNAFHDPLRSISIRM